MGVSRAAANLKVENQITRSAYTSKNNGFADPISWLSIDLE